MIKKDYYTLSEAARWLSGEYGKELTELDVLYCALNQGLKISANFINTERVIPCRIYDYKQSDFEAAIINDTPLPEWVKTEPTPTWVLNVPGNNFPHRTLAGGEWINSHQCLIYNDDVFSVTGVIDLFMIGNEYTEVKREFHRLQNHASVDREHDKIDGIFLEHDGQLYRLQKNPEDSEYEVGSRTYLEKNKNSSAEENIVMRNRFKKCFLVSHPKTENCTPAYRLPQDSYLVFRQDALSEFIQNIRELEQKTKTTELVSKTIKSNEEINLWDKRNPNDPDPEQPWYIAARYFARQVVADNPELLLVPKTLNRKKIAEKVIRLLDTHAIKGRLKTFSSSTVVKALTKVDLKK
jgi:hypothetical protein